MVALLVVHAIAALLAPMLVRRVGAKAFWALSVPPAATFAWALTQTVAARTSPPIEAYDWVPTIGMELVFRLDPLSWLLTLVVGGVGFLVLAYCSAYFSDDEPGLGRFAACLVAFAGAMLGLVTSDDALVLYLFWELTTVLSYLLIGHRPESRSSRAAATQALVVTTFGGLAMLVGIVMLGEQAGTYRISEMLANTPLDTMITAVAAGLLLLGAISKSALVPFHFWLPGAMAAPTPVSAYLHAAAMVKAGIYLVARFAPTFADVPGWRWIVLVLGGATMVIGAYRSLRQHDLKLLLAYGTVSQLGFLVILVGTGTADAALAGVTMLLAHALYKACLFLVVGAIDHSTGTRDLRKLSGLRRSMPGLGIASVIAAMSMAGLPPMLGFVGKEAAYDAFVGTGTAYGPWVLAVLVLGSMLTFAYSVRFVIGAFGDVRSLPDTPVHPAGPVLTGVPLTLAALTLLAGPVSAAFEPYLRAYSDTSAGAPAQVHLGLWHGVSAALILSLITWGVGILLATFAAPVERAQNAVPEIGSALVTYRFVMRSLDRLSLESTGLVQRGSLPLSLLLILLVFVFVPGLTLVLFPQEWGRADIVLADNAGQVATGVVTIVAAIGAVRSRRRLRAVFLVGVTGYGTAMLFLLHGGPDLALTQMLAETVSIVVFVLVLRRLAGRFDAQSRPSVRWARAVLGGVIGVIFAALALLMPGMRMHTPASDGMDVLAKTFGGGNNIVNIILVDIRAWDTMGELSVAVAAATGIASLIFLREENVEGARAKLSEILARRRAAAQRQVSPMPRGGKQAWLPEGSSLQADRRSVLLEVVARLIFHVVILWSIYLLFAGHGGPGGGFAAGLVAGLAICVRYLAGGRDELRAAVPVMPGLLLGLGLFLSAGFGVASMLVGGHVLQSWTFDIPVPLVGDVHIVTSLLFDVGVYLVVIGLLLDVLRSLGAALDRQIEEAEDTPRYGLEAPLHVNAGGD
ncbi:MAG: Na+/H+ antiporter subunit A [Dermatophilus congolensis]|nr:Na+/H+ antiporter subunit A [Dermatophilus congolensis]